MASSTVALLTAASALTGPELFYGDQSGDVKVTADQIKTFCKTIGSDTQVLFSDSGVAAGDAGLTFDKTSNALVAGGDIYSSTGLGSVGTGYWYFDGRINIYATANGDLQLLNTDDSSFGSLILGPSTASFVRLKRSGTTIEAKLGDDSAYALFRAARIGLGAAPTYALDVQTTVGTVAIRAKSDTNGDILFYGTGTVTGTCNFFNTAINASANVTAQIKNLNTSTGGVILFLGIDAATTGDAVVQYNVNGEQSWYVGVDGSDSNKFKIAGTVLGGGMDYISMTTAGVATFASGLTASGGFTAAARAIHSGGASPATATTGTDTTPSVTETHIVEVFVPCNMTVTGVALLNGSATAGNYQISMANSTGAPLAGAVTVSTAGSGAAAYQRIPFAVAWAAVGPATYYILLQNNNTGNRFRTHAAGNFGASVKTGETFGTFTSVTPPTTFTADKGPIATLY